MLRYIIKRLLQTILVLFLVVTLVFVLMRCIGDPTKLLVSPEGSYEDIENIKAALGLDKPVYVQYIDYMRGIVTGDFGSSYYYNRPVTDLIFEHLPTTLLLAGVAVVIAVPLAILFGVIAAVKRNTFLDNIVTTLSIAGRSLPSFWLGLLLVLLFSVFWKVLPPSGYGQPNQLIMPAITLAAGLCASITRFTRSSMLEVIRQDYMTTARAKGVYEKKVILHHGLRNALLPVVTMLGLQVGHLLGGSVVVESIFAWPGIGRMMVSAILTYDYPLVQACSLTMAVVFALVNFVTDMLYTVIDPRIRYN